MVGCCDKFIHVKMKISNPNRWETFGLNTNGVLVVLVVLI